MANVRQEYINRTYNALVNYQSNVNAQRRRFRNSNYGDQTPIDAKQLDNVPKGKVVLNSQVFEQLIQINDESEKAKAEFSYLLTGITEGQTIKFDNPPTILECASIVGPKESKGPLAKYFDQTLEDEFWGEKTWEKAGSKTCNSL